MTVKTDQNRSKSTSLSSAGKALTILECFDRDAFRLSLADIAKKTGFYKSTILRLIKDLQAFGYIHKDSDGRYLLGSAPLRLGDVYRLGFSSGASIQTCLQKISEKTGESTAFYIREGDYRICLYRRHSQHLLRTHVEIGDKISLQGRGAGSRIILAFTELDSQQPDLIATREKGYTCSVGERTPGVASVSLPIFVSDGKFAGAMVVSGAATRFDDAARLEALQFAQEEIIRQGLHTSRNQYF